MSNNNAIIDAVITGAGGGAQTSWLASQNPDTYNTFKVAIETIALAVDGLILPISPGPSLSQIQLMQSITAAVLSGRYPVNPNPESYASIATNIVVLYNKMMTSLTNSPDIYGGSTQTNLSNVIFADINTTVPLLDQTGNIEAPVSSLSAAVTACPEHGLVMFAPGNYCPSGPPSGILNVTKSMSFQSLIDSPTVPMRTKPSVDVIGITVDFELQASFSGITCVGYYGPGGITCTDDGCIIRLYNCNPFLLTNGTYYATNCSTVIPLTIGGGTFDGCEIAGGIMHITSTHVTFRRCMFISDISPSITFDGVFGIVYLDNESYQSWLSAGVELINGTITLLEALPSARISVDVPAITAAGVAYVTVSTIGTLLEGIITDTPILANPTSDIEPAGANAGGFLNARVSATDTITCTFLGVTTGGAVDIVFTRIGMAI
jgi:hypothetical protein